MFGTMILGLIAGAVAPYLEPHIKRFLEDALMAEAGPSAAELRGLSLAVALFLAALIAMVLTGGGSVALTLGAVLGVFGPRLLQRIRK